MKWKAASDIYSTKNTLNFPHAADYVTPRSLVQNTSFFLLLLC